MDARQRVAEVGIVLGESLELFQRALDAGALVLRRDVRGDALRGGGLGRRVRGWGRDGRAGSGRGRGLLPPELGRAVARGDGDVIAATEGGGDVSGEGRGNASSPGRPGSASARTKRPEGNEKNLRSGGRQTNLGSLLRKRAMRAASSDVVRDIDLAARCVRLSSRAPQSRFDCDPAGPPTVLFANFEF